VQTPPAVALLGEQTRFSGMDRSVAYRWFMDHNSRRIYPEDDHPLHSRINTATLRTAATQDGPHSRAAAIAHYLRTHSTEFALLWAEHEIGIRYLDTKRVVHPELGVLELHCQTLLDPDQAQVLLIFTATPGTDSFDKLQLLAVIGGQQLTT